MNQLNRDDGLEGKVAVISGQAADAAREALATEGIGSWNRAAIAEELAELGAPDVGAVLEARRVAWRSRPDKTSLLLLHHAASQLGDPAQVLAEELAYTESDQQSEPLGGSLFSSLLLLSGEVERATELLSQPTAQREREVSGSILIPYLLVSASKSLDGAGDAVSWANGYLNNVNRSSGLYGRPGKLDREGIPKLSELFAARICAETTEPMALESRLEAALGPARPGRRCGRVGQAPRRVPEGGRVAGRRCIGAVSRPRRECRSVLVPGMVHPLPAACCIPQGAGESVVRRCIHEMNQSWRRRFARYPGVIIREPRSYDETNCRAEGCVSSFWSVRIVLQKPVQFKG